MDTDNDNIHIFGHFVELLFMENALVDEYSLVRRLLDIYLDHRQETSMEWQSYCLGWFKCYPGRMLDFYLCSSQVTCPRVYISI